MATSSLPAWPAAIPRFPSDVGDCTLEHRHARRLVPRRSRGIPRNPLELHGAWTVADTTCRDRRCTRLSRSQHSLHVDRMVGLDPSLVGVHHPPRSRLGCRNPNAGLASRPCDPVAARKIRRLLALPTRLDLARMEHHRIGRLAYRRPTLARGHRSADPRFDRQCSDQQPSKSW